MSLGPHAQEVDGARQRADGALDPEPLRRFAAEPCATEGKGVGKCGRVVTGGREHADDRGQGLRSFNGIGQVKCALPKGLRFLGRTTVETHDGHGVLASCGRASGPPTAVASRRADQQ
jgi:hypothetical protein